MVEYIQLHIIASRIWKQKHYFGIVVHYFFRSWLLLGGGVWPYMHYFFAYFLDENAIVAL